MSKKIAVLSVGPDLDSDGGGIASVVKNYYSAYLEGDYNFEFLLHRTIGHRSGYLIGNSIYFLYSLLRLILILIGNKNIKIIHIHTSSHYSFFRKSVIVLISKIFRKKTIIHLHSSRFYNFFLADSRIVRMWINYIFNKVDVVISLCKKWEFELKEKYTKANIVTIYNPIVIEPALQHIERERDFNKTFTVLFVAFLSPNKGLKDLLEVAEYFYKNNSNIQFKVAGIGKLEEYLKEKIREKVYSNVEYVGWADYEKKKVLYRNANIFFLPSYNEGMPISILEAMAFSLPIVSTTVSGIPDEVENGVNGFVYKAGDIKGYINGIRTLYNNKDFYKQASLSSWNKVQAFSSNEIFKKVVELYF